MMTKLDKRFGLTGSEDEGHLDWFVYIKFYLKHYLFNYFYNEPDFTLGVIAVGD